jgi:hypothetical protein
MTKGVQYLLESDRQLGRGGLRTYIVAVGEWGGRGKRISENVSLEDTLFLEDSVVP